MTVHWPTTAFRKSTTSPEALRRICVCGSRCLFFDREGQYGQDIFTLRSTYFERHPQAPIHMHWRRFKVSDIPLENLEDFHAWLIARWNEKEILLEHHAKTGQFPSSINEGKCITTEVKLGRWWEIGQLCAVLAPFLAGIFAISRFVRWVRFG